MTPNPGGRRSGAESGFSIIELMTVVITMSVMLLAATLVFKHSTQAGIRLESNNNLKNFEQMAINSVKFHISQSRTIYQNDAYGQALWGRLAIPYAHPALNPTTLPAIRETGSLSPSQIGAGTFDRSTVGNALLFTESEGYTAAGSRWIDMYRPRAYYLSKSTSISVAKRGYGYDLIEWVGKKYADYSELVGADSTVFASLISKGITEAWNSAGTTAATTVYTIGAGGTLSAQAAPTLAPVTVQSATHLFGSNGDTHYAVAFNNGAGFNVQDSVPEYATASAGGDGFPNGFETMVVGATGGRKILIRLVMVAEGYAGTYSLGLEMVAAARNY
jgi:hypothetical protein